MDSLRIIGGKSLHGEITISGAKNATLPLMAASLLSDETLRIGNAPDLVDIASMAYLLEELGADISTSGDTGPERTLELSVLRLRKTDAPYELVRQMRASVLVLGPLLARAGEARVSLPGGCAIGTRPIDLHLKGLEKLGAKIELADGYVNATAPKGLHGGHVVFPSVTVGGTENILMAATLAQGETVISNAAKEPEVVDLAHCLVAMGAEIDGIGTDALTVRGVARLHGATYDVLADRIEVGSYAVAAAITDGELFLRGARVETLAAVIGLLGRAGVAFEEKPDGLRVSRKGTLRGVDLLTEPFPGFPTDMQAQFMTLMSVARGASMVTESIFENRFMHVPELCRMGADINVHGASAIIRGVETLSGAPVMATDLRASVSLVLAGLAATGETRVSRVYHLDRGYERLVEKLTRCGARIERVKD
jgi:UDP-N-acetylglucosamine 1-carboxyvinyltransferase